MPITEFYYKSQGIADNAYDTGKLTADGKQGE